MPSKPTESVPAPVSTTNCPRCNGQRVNRNHSPGCPVKIAERAARKLPAPVSSSVAATIESLTASLQRAEADRDDFERAEAERDAALSQVERLTEELVQRTLERDAAMEGQRIRQGQFTKMADLADEALAQRDALRAELATLKQKESLDQAWVPVEEGLPTHGGQVEITFLVGDSGPFVTHATYEKGRWDWNSAHANMYRKDSDVTAWRSLRAPYVAPLPDGGGK